MKFRKKPIEIEAMQLTPQSYKECLEFAGKDAIPERNDEYRCWIGLKTLEGNFGAMHGDWLIRGVQGEIYPCKPDIFRETYEQVEI